MEQNIDPMMYITGMEIIDSDILDKVISKMNSYDSNKYTASDVYKALQKDILYIEDFGALLSPAAIPFLEDIARRARIETRKHFGNSIYMFTPLYISNYCENHCVYCGFNCNNKIKRAKLTNEEIEKEMEIISETGLKEILILTGESKNMSSTSYIGNACKIARKYFNVIGLEIYPVNSDEYSYLHKCGADYITVFQETYNLETYKKLHLSGNNRIFPSSFNAQERAL